MGGIGGWYLMLANRKFPPMRSVLRAVEGNTVTVIPSHDIVIVRRGLDFAGAAFDQWSLVREVLKAFPPSTSPTKSR